MHSLPEQDHQLQVTIILINYTQKKTYTENITEQMKSSASQAVHAWLVVA